LSKKKGKNGDGKRIIKLGEKTAGFIKIEKEVCGTSHANQAKKEKYKYDG